MRKRRKLKKLLWDGSELKPQDLTIFHWWMKPSAFGGGGATAAAARGFKSRKFGVSRPTKFQPVGGKGKKAAGKGIKSSK
nr:hypothetical protein CFP56_15896 [Quercus suber]